MRLRMVIGSCCRRPVARLEAASRALVTPEPNETHSIESARPMLAWVLSPLMSEPFAFRNRCTV
jgi:hypothetical protein